MNIFLRCLLRWRESLNHFVADKRISSFVFRPSSFVLRNKTGQVAVILILVTAIALIFYAISLNFGRLSQLKTITTIASNTGTSLLASEMASYGQKVAVEKISGDRKRCKSSGVFRAIVIGIGAIVLAYFTVGLSLGILLLVVATVVMQITVIEPGLTNSWHTIMAKVLTPQDMFIEKGIQTALQGAVTDTVQVADLNDADEDGVFGLDADGVPKDRIGRYGFYYYENRLKKVLPKNTGPLDRFLCELNDFLHDDECMHRSPGWGLYDPLNRSIPVGYTGGCATAECDWCCLPDVDLKYGEVIRPPECSSTVDWNAVCGAKSPYGLNYPWVYDSYYENREDGFLFVSFREQLGRDDEHMDYYRNSANPDEIPQTLHLAGDEGFHLNDTTNFYVPPYYNPVPWEKRRGIFPFFYKAADWALDLTRRNPVGNREHCYWSDYTNGYDPSCPLPPLSAELGGPLAPRLNLPINPAAPALIYNKNPYVDDVLDNIPGNPPLAPDKVGLPQNVFAPNDDCAQNALTDVTVDGFWKRGGDRFCSGAWPYAEHCPKHGECSFGTESVDCACGQTADVITPPGTPDNWPDDVLDDLVYHMPAFIQWAEESVLSGSIRLAGQFEVWYQGAAQWIEPGTDPPPVGSNAVAGDTCFSETCKPEDGWLHRWRKQIQMMVDRLENLRTVSYAGIDTDGPGPITPCNQVWCVPRAGCVSIPAAEEATFGTRNIEGVIACLNWNANNSITDGVTAATGNAEKFQACDNACRAPDYNAANFFCANLPRSLVPGFAPSVFDDVNIPLVTTLEGCTAAWCTACSIACDALDPCDAACNAACKAACICGGFACTSPTFVTDVADALKSAKGSCAEDAGIPDEFLDLVVQSGLEAENQVAKFEQRRAFLRNRLDELNNILNNVLIPARDEFDKFLTCDDNDTYGGPIGIPDGEPDGPACRVIKDRIKYKYEPSGLPYEAVYGWQTPDPPRWHIVKVEARIPGKCDDACNTDQNPARLDPAWPWIETWTKGFLDTTRCYEMRSTEGIVKTRVTRFDERRDSSMLSFANGVPIWQFKYAHPERPVDYTTTNIYNPATELGVCGDSMINEFPPGNWLGNPLCIAACGPEPVCAAGCAVDPDPPMCESLCPRDPPCVTLCGQPFYQGAFILNEEIDDPECWRSVHNILTRGVTSETCAQYYWQGGMRHGMNFKFVPCKEF